METAYKIFDNFSTLCGVGVIVIDKNGQILYASEEYKRHIEAENALEKVFCNADQCQVSMVYGSYQAQRFGGRYIFFCPKGLIHCASPLVKNGEMYASVIAGPLLMTDYEEYLEVDVKGKFSLSPEILQELGEKIRLIPFISPERVQAMSEQLFVNVSYICGETQKALGYEQEQKRLQAAISEYIIKMKPASDSGWYPLSTEDQLLQSMSSGDKFAAKGLLNELLSHIFFHADVFKCNFNHFFLPL